MPELPEVETIARRLQSVLPGRQISAVAVFREKSFEGESRQLVGMAIIGVSRRAKLLSIELSNGMFVVVHLKMTGQMIYVDGATRLGGGHPTQEFVTELPAKATRIQMSFTDGSALFFNDQRVFGWWKLLNAAAREQEIGKYAPDVIDEAVTLKYLVEKFAKRSAAIKLVIMDQAVVSGVGNIYACDGLFEAQIDPIRSANSLTRKEISRLLTALRLVIHQGIELGGATIQHYRTADGLSGKYQDVRRVYAKEGEDCPSCGHPITRIKQAGRSTFWCENCQH